MPVQEPSGSQGVCSPSSRLEISAGAEEDDVDAGNTNAGGGGGDIAVDGMVESVPVAADSPADVDAPASAQQSDIVYHPRTALAKVGAGGRSTSVKLKHDVCGLTGLDLGTPYDGVESVRT